MKLKGTTQSQEQALNLDWKKCMHIFEKLTNFNLYLLKIKKHRKSKIKTI